MSRLHSLVAALPVGGRAFSKRFGLAALATALVLPVAAIGVGFAGEKITSAGARPQSAHALTAFRSDAELAAFLRGLRKRDEPPVAMSDAVSAPPAMAAQA